MADIDEIMPEWVQKIANSMANVINTPGWIVLRSIKAKSYTSIVVKFIFYNKPGTNFTANSIRLYYTTTPGQGNADYIDITKANADYWKLNKDKASYTVKYTLTGLLYNTKYYVRVWLRLFNKSGSKVKYSYKSPAAAPIACTTASYDRSTPLFQMCTFKLNNPSDENSSYLDWEDFTQNITMGSYDVIQTDVTEEWTDANYKTHKIVTRTKVSGKFNMLFSSKEEFNKFLNIVRLNRYVYPSGMVHLNVHLNNQLEYDTDWQSIGIDNLRNDDYEGDFYITISSLPWVEPYYGHYDKYSPISVSIEEA